MNHFNRSLTAIAVLTSLTGCNGGGSDDSPTPEPRTVEVGIQTIEIAEPEIDMQGRMHTKAVDTRNYVHSLGTEGYQLCMTDTLATDCVEVSIDQPDGWTHTFQVVGAATFIVNPPAYTGRIQDHYWVSGDATAPIGEQEVNITLSNKQWAYITLDDNEYIMDELPPTLDDLDDITNPQDMNLLPDGYWYKYVLAGSNVDLAIPVSTGEILTKTLPLVTANDHFAYALAYSPDSNVGFTIEDLWKEPENICIGTCVDTPVDPDEPVNENADDNNLPYYSPLVQLTGASGSKDLVVAIDNTVTLTANYTYPNMVVSTTKYAGYKLSDLTVVSSVSASAPSAYIRVEAIILNQDGSATTKNAANWTDLVNANPDAVIADVDGNIAVHAEQTQYTSNMKLFINEFTITLN